jgi:hypothetical protein
MNRARKQLESRLIFHNGRNGCDVRLGGRRRKWSACMRTTLLTSAPSSYSKLSCVQSRSGGGGALKVVRRPCLAHSLSPPPSRRTSDRRMCSPAHSSAVSLLVASLATLLALTLALPPFEIRSSSDQKSEGAEQWIEKLQRIKGGLESSRLLASSFALAHAATLSKDGISSPTNAVRRQPTY